jgi:hypothetical protein
METSLWILRRLQHLLAIDMEVRERGPPVRCPGGGCKQVEHGASCMLWGQAQELRDPEQRNEQFLRFVCRLLCFVSSHHNLRTLRMARLTSLTQIAPTGKDVREGKKLRFYFSIHARGQICQIVEKSPMILTLVHFHAALIQKKLRLCSAVEPCIFFTVPRIA